MSNKKQKKQSYVFEFMWLTDTDEGSMLGVRLADGTELLCLEDECLTLRFPKSKFSRLFKKQELNKNLKFFSLDFSRVEVEAMLKGLNMAVAKVESERAKKHGKSDKKNKGV